MSKVILNRDDYQDGLEAIGVALGMLTMAVEGDASGILVRIKTAIHSLRAAQSIFVGSVIMPGDEAYSVGE